MTEERKPDPFLRHARPDCPGTWDIEPGLAAFGYYDGTVMEGTSYVVCLTCGARPGADYKPPC